MGINVNINSIDRIKPTPERSSAIEKIGDEEKDFFSKNKKRQAFEYEHEIDEIEEKINKIVKSNDLLRSLGIDSVDQIKSKKKLLELAENAAASFLKKELLNVAKSILSLSIENNFNDQLDDTDLSYADILARYVMKLSNSKDGVKKSTNKTFKMPNANTDKNAGFLVHYCKDILNKKIQNQSNDHKLKKLSKEEVEKLIRK
ncbi:MAG: hypothetical protein JXA94_05250 [Parachlamydiales bacterium]|nr:hypothetical protein [Parachlamydiales bacterium]